MSITSKRKEDLISEISCYLVGMQFWRWLRASAPVLEGHQAVWACRIPAADCALILCAVIQQGSEMNRVGVTMFKTFICITYSMRSALPLKCPLISGHFLSIVVCPYFYLPILELTRTLTFFSNTYTVVFIICLIYRQKCRCHFWPDIDSSPACEVFDLFLCFCSWATLLMEVIIHTFHPL